MSVNSRPCVIINRVATCNVYRDTKRTRDRWTRRAVEMDSVLVVVNLIVAIDQDTGKCRVDNLDAIGVVPKFIAGDDQRVTAPHIRHANRRSEARDVKTTD